MPKRTVPAAGGALPAAHPSRRAALTALVASPPPWRPRENPPPLRSFIRDVAGLPIVAATAVAVPGLVAAETIPHRPTAMLLHAYKKWLHNETRLLNVELFPRDWKEMEYCIFFTGIGGYHWNDYPNGPKPSTRAAVVLDAVGAKWRGLSDRDHLPEGPPSIPTQPLPRTCGNESIRCDELQVFRDPLGWLRNLCRGVVIIDGVKAAPLLRPTEPLASRWRAAA